MRRTPSAGTPEGELALGLAGVAAGVKLEATLFAESPELQAISAKVARIVSANEMRKRMNSLQSKWVVTKQQTRT